MALIQDYKDVIKLAYQTETYWTRSKVLMIKGHHWYNLEVPIATPKGVQYSAPPTAPSIVNDAADHLAGNWPEYTVKPLKETQTSGRDQERLEIALNAVYNRLARDFGKAIHRTMAIHGGWSGMMAASIGVRDGWDPNNPTIDDFYWHPRDPRFVFPDPGSLGGEFVIYRTRRTVGSVRQDWPDWEGQWYSPAGWGSWNTGPDTPRLNERLPDWTVVDWIEYWDDRVKCFVSNGYPVFRSTYGEDVIPHGLGINPFVIRSAGYGDDTGEPYERFRSMLYYVFGLLQSEAELWTQYKWIVEDTAWPTLLAHDSLRPLDLTPASVNYSNNLDAIVKGLRPIRNDAVEPKAVIDSLAWVQSAIEAATYPQILKGQAPNGIKAGYPIAILSTQAKIKFASPADALQAMLLELAEKTLAVVKNRIAMPVEVIDNYHLMPDDYDKYRGRIKVALDPQLPTDRAAMIPILQLAVGSLGLPKEYALKELGYEDPYELREQRTAEDLAEDPRVRELMGEHYLQYLDPDYAAALKQELNSNNQIQKLQENTQYLQGQIAAMQAQLQLIQAQTQLSQADQQQQSGQQPQGPAAGPLPQLPQQQAPAPTAPPGEWGGARPGAGGSPLFGQNPQMPNQLGMSLQHTNPASSMTAMARELRAQHSMDMLEAQQTIYGEPTSVGET